MASKAYYNEFDPGAAEWLRELIRGGHIAPGDVDERSIADVRPTDLLGYGQCHFFAGIGGWSHALRLAGWGDRRPVWTGSCPCQPYSSAGRGLGDADHRNLWSDFFRLIRECCPECVFGEQVESAVRHGWLDRVSTDLEGAGYAVGAAVLGAHSVGAPHIRQRLYWVADANPDNGGRHSGGLRPPETAKLRQRVQGVPDGPAIGGNLSCGVGDTHGKRESPLGGVREGAGIERAGSAGGMDNALFAGSQAHEAPGPPQGRAVGRARPTARPWSNFDAVPCRDGRTRRTEPGVFPLAHGLPGRVGLLRGYGNSIVPQVAAEFIQAYRETKGE